MPGDSFTIRTFLAHSYLLSAAIEARKRADVNRILKYILFAYRAVPTNTKSLVAFRQYVTDLWGRSLRRRARRIRLQGYGVFSNPKMRLKVSGR